MAQPREAVPSFRDRMVYLISPVNLRVPEGFVRAKSGRVHCVRTLRLNAAEIECGPVRLMG